jgi:hypothetical protein
MTKQLLVVFLLLVATAVAEDGGLIIQASGKNVVAVDAQKIYISGCEAVRKEFGATQQHTPRITLVIGGETDEAIWKAKEIRLRKWDPYLFAQGVVLLAFDDLMTGERRLKIAKRVVSRAESTVSATELAK